MKNCKTLALLSIALIFAALGTISCGPKGDPADIAKIDSLIAINNEVGEALAKVDTAQVLSSRALFAENWKEISTLVDSLTRSSDARMDSAWQYVTVYESKDRQLKKLMRRYRSYKKAFELNREQLSNLRESVARAQIPADSVGIYITTEGLEVYSLKKQLDLYYDDLISSAAALDSLHQYAPDAINHYKRTLVEASEK